MSRQRPDKIAADGLPARDSGSWAQDKLSFIDRFVPVALQATQAKRERHYVDLFAGPGLNIDRRSGAEFYATADDAGDRIARWEAAQAATSDQYGLDL